MSTTTTSSSEFKATGIVDYGLLFVLGVIWGSSFPVIRFAVTDVDPILVTFGRLSIAALVMISICAVQSRWRAVGFERWISIVAIAILGNALPFFLISWGEQRVEAGVAAIVMALMPLMVFIAAHLVTDDEKLTWRKAVGLVCGLVGVVVLVNPWPVVGAVTSSGFAWSPWHIAAIGTAAACYACNAILMRNVAQLDRVFVVTAVLGLATILMLPFALPQLLDVFFGEELLNVRAAGAIVVLGVVQTALATLLMFQIVRRQGASFFSQINFLVPIFGVLIGAIWLEEVVQPTALVALALILGGVGLSRRSGVA